ncbi:hypothetical protein N7539_005384 [Penicillium diatomitis]|uniref:Uncharacterized protein n=1 Tax=Penicillium diatomitis TaxID=2819901 RepID=A0A9W9X774_9EURO|nr:uncharacterized protein N7539_005384 [Penicillium diatomitis]KAJ5485396.1 hypothetical protein N7539_005384 [Penicillium diatomitis]
MDKMNGYTRAIKRERGCLWDKGASKVQMDHRGSEANAEDCGVGTQSTEARRTVECWEGAAAEKKWRWMQNRKSTRQSRLMHSSRVAKLW